MSEELLPPLLLYKTPGNDIMLVKHSAFHVQDFLNCLGKYVLQFFYTLKSLVNMHILMLLSTNLKEKEIYLAILFLKK